MPRGSSSNSNHMPACLPTRLLLRPRARARQMQQGPLVCNHWLPRSLGPHKVGGTLARVYRRVASRGVPDRAWGSQMILPWQPWLVSGPTRQRPGLQSAEWSLSSYPVQTPLHLRPRGATTFCCAFKTVSSKDIAPREPGEISSDPQLWGEPKESPTTCTHLWRPNLGAAGAQPPGLQR